MKSVLVAALVALVVSILCTPAAIKLFRRHGFGQEIRDDGPQTHLAKRGTPTMGGAVIILGTVLGYTVSHLVVATQTGRGPTASGLLVLYLMVVLGLVGFLDDFIKVRKQRSLGLNTTTKLVGQLFAAVSFAVLALQFHSHGRLSPASVHLSFVRDIAVISFGSVGFVVFAVLLISGFSNAVNLTDGLDGLAAGSSVMVLGAYVIISFYQFRNACGVLGAKPGCYVVRDPLDVALVAAAALGACFGFLWWNAYPARIIMGDTGSLALGGLLAGIAVMTRTELLLVVLGGLFVVETLSVALQVAVFKATRKRVFNMAPIHHHFELAGWQEMTVIVRFWIITGLAVAFGMGLFYAEFISYGLPG
ncbi:MAG TPA: phospho-N-acetylmuramoyl-pentapeptide-transferase [Mycobacteriales bacterium]